MIINKAEASALTSWKARVGFAVHSEASMVSKLCDENQGDSNLRFFKVYTKFLLVGRWQTQTVINHFSSHCKSSQRCKQKLSPVGRNISQLEERSKIGVKNC